MHRGKEKGKYYRRKLKYFSSEDFENLTTAELKQVLIPLGLTVEEALIIYKRLNAAEPDNEEYKLKINWLTAMVNDNPYNLYMEFRP